MRIIDREAEQPGGHRDRIAQPVQQRLRSKTGPQYLLKRNEYLADGHEPGGDRSAPGGDRVPMGDAPGSPERLLRSRYRAGECISEGSVCGRSPSAIRPPGRPDPAQSEHDDLIPLDLRACLDRVYDEGRLRPRRSTTPSRPYPPLRQADAEWAAELLKNTPANEEVGPPPMIRIPALRFGKPYTSLEKATLVHHVTGEPVAEVSQVTGQHDRPRPRQHRARATRNSPPSRSATSSAMYKKAADYFLNGALPCGDAELTFDRATSATCRPPPGRRWCSATGTPGRCSTSSRTSRR